MAQNSFPEGFLWGVAASAYQIEGAVSADGRGISIWDTFSHTPGKVYKGHTGDVACDHYHRWEADLDLMQRLGIQAYRFSVAWPRVLPEGRGRVNPKGLDFYDRLVDGLLARQIRPYVNLFHWDLPQPLQDEGGWAVRSTAEAFGEYARIVAERVGDRVGDWVTHNEPMVTAYGGYLTGDLAPGIQDPAAAFKAVFHLHLSHGIAVAQLRASLPGAARIGIVLNLSPVHPATNSPEDQAAASRYDGAVNRVFLDPLFTGRFPAEFETLVGMFVPGITATDLAMVAAPLDFIGVNYYSRNVICHDPETPLIQARQIHPPGNEYSQMWEVYPPGLSEILLRVWREYIQPHRPQMRMLVAENGICVPDDVDLDGRVRDERRIRYLENHIEQVALARAAGAPLDGYFVWSLLDNFEWGYGYRMRFGLVFVDFDTQDRIPKDSAEWYSRVIRNNGLAGR